MGNMQNKRYSIQSSYLNVYNVFDDEEKKPLSSYEVINKLNSFTEEKQKMIEDLRIVLPILLVVDFKISINECEAINRLAKLCKDEFIVGCEIKQE